MDDPRELMLQNAEEGDARGLEAALQQGEASRVERGKRGLLHLASAGGYLNALALLLRYQADTSARSSKDDDHGGTALHLAAAGGHEQVMEALLEAGADTEARDDKGKKPVHAAAYNGQLGSLEVLRRYNCNLSAQSHARSTALHYAAFYGDLEVVRWLVRNGVKHDLKDKSGRLPKDVAKEHKHHDVHNFLKDYNGRKKDIDTSSNRGGSFRLTKKRRSLSVSSLFKNKSSAGDFISRQDDPPSPSYDRKSSPGPTSEISSIRPPPSPALDTSTIRKVEDWRARGMEAASLTGEGDVTQEYDMSPTPASFTPAPHYVHSTPLPPPIPISASHYTREAPYSPTAPDASYTYAQEEYEIHLRRKELELYELRMKMRQMEQRSEAMKHWGAEVEKLREAQKAWEAKEKDWEGELRAAREEERLEMEEEMKRLEETADTARQEAEEERQRAEESTAKVREEHQEAKLGLEQQVYTLSLQIQQYHQRLEQQGRVEAELRGADKAMQNALAAAEDTAVHLTQRLEETRAQLEQTKGQVEENAKLRKELEESTRRLKEREKHLEENKEQMEEREKYMDENRRLERELEESKKHLEDRQKQLEESMKLARDLEAERGQLEETCSQLEHNNRRLEMSEKQLDDTKKQLAQHQAREEEQRQTKEQDSDIIDHLNTQIKSLSARLNESEEARLTTEDEMEEREEVSQREIEKLQQQLKQQEASHQQTITTLREELQREAQKTQQQETQQKGGDCEHEVDQQSVSELRAQVHSLSKRLENRIQDLVMAETRQREQEAQSEKVIAALKRQLAVLQQQNQSQAVAQLEAEKQELTKALEAVKKDKHHQEANGDASEGSRASDREAIQREVNAKLEVWRRDLLRDREANQKKLKEVSKRLEIERKEWTKTLDITQRRLQEVSAEYEAAKKEWVRDKDKILKQLQGVTHRYESESIQVSSMYTTGEKTREAEGSSQQTATRKEGQKRQEGKRKEEKQQTQDSITQLIEELVEAKQEKGTALTQTQSHTEDWKKESSPDLVVSAVRPSTAGLPNLGNTCYMSAIMQCLYSVTSLREYFTSNAYKNDVSPRSGCGGDVAEAVARVMTSHGTGHLPSITRDLTHLKSVVSGLDQEFRGREQRDAHDLLTVLLAALHKDLLKSDGTSVIQEVTHGEEVAAISCEVYGEITRTREPFPSLSLVIPQHRISLQAALARHYWLQGVEWDCPHCRRCHLCRHQTSLARLPPVLIIHLCRKSEAETTSKTKVDFPADNFALSQHLPEGLHSPLYELVGVVSHHGTLSSGHYTAFCRKNSDLTWSLYDDQQVTHTSLQRVKSDPDAYLLFYQSVK